MHEDVFKNWLEQTEDISKAKCKVCNLLLGTKRSDLLKHQKSQKHEKNMKALQGTKKLDQVFQQSVKEDKTQIVTDIRFCLLAISHNLSFSSIDHITEVSKLNFSDSNVAKNLKLKRTKCTSIVKNVLSSAIKEELSHELRDNNFSVHVQMKVQIYSTVMYIGKIHF